MPTYRYFAVSQHIFRAKRLFSTTHADLPMHLVGFSNIMIQIIRELGFMNAPGTLSTYFVHIQKAVSNNLPRTSLKSCLRASSRVGLARLCALFKTSETELNDKRPRLKSYLKTLRATALKSPVYQLHTAMVIVVLKYLESQRIFSGLEVQILSPRFFTHCFDSGYSFSGVPPLSHSPANPYGIYMAKGSTPFASFSKINTLQEKIRKYSLKFCPDLA